ncbi:hypothetical protein P6B95_00380 [Streptomyces atratus]|uniref:hypothetical protein n=1 Tax=Streptomyces atratus TaxID=1893 RepID=UPI0016704028|nr:hypothetical protein [Streptomyces atratus]WPW26082.1 hypothetical protein P6B95_00380 [Streptomyces atratus]GGT65149.1 hypothetical protein GCM10010207_75470 [Streptomyces atratus]
MYLVHLRLLPHPEGEQLPASTAALLTQGRDADADRIEHVSLHADAQPCPVVGVYVQAANLERAEAAAERAWTRAVVAHPPLAHWKLLSAEVPLLRPDLDE